MLIELARTSRDNLRPVRDENGDIAGPPRNVAKAQKIRDCRQRV